MKRAIAASLGMALLLSGLAAWHWVQPVLAKLGPPALPQALYMPPSGGRVVVDTPLAKCHYDFDSEKREIEIQRRERANPGAAWSSTKQELTTSYDIAWVVGRADAQSRLDVLYVAGTYDTGTTTIEKFRFDYGLTAVPKVTRAVLYQGTTLGIFSCVELNGAGTQLFAVTHGSTPKVYRVSTTGVSAPTVVASPATIPELGTAAVWTIKRRVHVSEGPKYLLTDDRLHALNDMPTNDYVIALNDPDDDGVIDSHLAYTASDWDGAGMDEFTNWVQ